MSLAGFGFGLLSLGNCVEPPSFERGSLSFETPFPQNVRIRFRWMLPQVGLQRTIWRVCRN